MCSFQNLNIFLHAFSTVAINMLSRTICDFGSSQTFKCCSVYLHFTLIQSQPHPSALPRYLTPPLCKSSGSYLLSRAKLRASNWHFAESPSLTTMSQLNCLFMPVLTPYQTLVRLCDNMYSYFLCVCVCLRIGSCANAYVAAKTVFLRSNSQI